MVMNVVYRHLSGGATTTNIKKTERANEGFTWGQTNIKQVENKH